MSGSLWIPETDVAGAQATIAANKRWQSRLFTASGTWTVPADVGVVWVDGCAGGSGGGGGDPTPGGGGGGGCAGEALAPAIPLSVIPGETLTLTIGAGGLGGAVNIVGSSGGTTTIVGTNCFVNISAGIAGGRGAGTTGGSGGGFNGGNPTTAAGGASGVTGGVSSLRSPFAISYYGHPYYSNMPRFSGGAGGGGLNANGGGSYEGNGFSMRAGGTGSASGGGGGAGGSNPFGVGGLGGSGGAAGGHATGYGGGGGGGGGNAAGGNGSPGMIRIYCFSATTI